MERRSLAILFPLLIPTLIDAQVSQEELERLRSEAEAARAALRAAREKFEVLATVVRLRNAEESAEELYPPWPEKIGAMQAWLDEARAIAAQLAPLEAELAELRAQATRTPSGALEFADAAARFLYDTLVRLSGDLQRFAGKDGTLRAVERRLAWAREVRGESFKDHLEAWRTAIEAIRRSPVYGGLELEPQIGLLPVGVDPQSGLWEFAHLKSGAVPTRDDSGALKTTKDTGLVFVLLPGGALAVGGQREHVEPLAPFFLSKYELTGEQWRRLTGEEPKEEPETPRETKEDESLGHRVRQVLFRHGLVLPTETQWEYACRAGVENVAPAGEVPGGDRPRDGKPVVRPARTVR